MNKIFLFGILILFSLTFIQSLQWTSELSYITSHCYSYDEGVGTKVRDEIFSNQKNMTGLPGTGWTNGKLINKSYYSGAEKAGGYATGINASEFVENGLSISVWINASSIISGGAIVSSRDETGTGYLDLALYPTNARFRVELYDHGKVDHVDGSILNLDNNNWNHLVVVINSSSLYVYRNGTLDVLLPLVYFNFTRLGGLFNISGRSYAGDAQDGTTIDELVFFNRTLTANEVTTLYNDGVGIQYTVIDNLNSAPEILLNSTIPTSLAISLNNSYINTTVFDNDEDSIDSILFTVISSNGSAVMNNSNGTRITGSSMLGQNETWNSPTFNISAKIESYGWWNWSYIIVSNGSAQNTTQTGKFLITAMPQLTITYPLNNSVIWQNVSIDLNFTYIAGAYPIFNCWYQLNDSGSVNISMTSCNNFKFGYAPGTWNLSLFINDTAGQINSSTLYNLTFKYDNINPLVKVNSPTGTLSSQTFQVSINVTDLGGVDYCYYNITRGASTEIANTNISNCSDIQATVSGDATYVFHVWINDSTGNFNATEETFIVSTSSPITPSGGGGAPTETEKIPAISIKDITSTNTYNYLDRAVLFARINDYCSNKKEGVSLAVSDFSGECSLTKDDLQIIKTGIITQGIEVTIEDLVLFYSNFNKKLLEQGYFTLTEIQTYKLYTSVLGVLNPMVINPPRLDRPFIKFFKENNGLIEYSFTSNKDIRDCSVLSGNFRCNLLSNTTFKVTLDINDTNFFDKIFNGEISVTSSADPKNLEVKRVSLYPRVYNLYYTFAGIPVIVFLVLAVVILLITSIFFIRRGKIKKGIWRNR